MNLSDRLREREVVDVLNHMSNGDGRRRLDVLSEFKKRVNAALYASLGSRLFDASLTEDQLRAMVGRRSPGSWRAPRRPSRPRSASGSARRSSTTSSVVGPIEEFMKDPSVSEVMVNGADHIYVERHGVIEETGAGSCPRTTSVR